MLLVVIESDLNTFYFCRVSDSHVLGQKVVRGKTEGMLQLLVFVENRGEGSYETILNITLPPGVKFFGITDRKYVSSITPEMRWYLYQTV